MGGGPSKQPVVWDADSASPFEGASARVRTGVWEPNLERLREGFAQIEDNGYRVACVSVHPADYDDFVEALGTNTENGEGLWGAKIHQGAHIPLGITQIMADYRDVVLRIRSDDWQDRHRTNATLVYLRRRRVESA